MVLGGGTGGTLVANRLARRLRNGRAEVVVVDRDDRYIYLRVAPVVSLEIEDAKFRRTAAAG